MLPLGIKRPATSIFLYSLAYKFPLLEGRLAFSFSHTHVLNQPGFDWQGKYGLSYKVGNYTTINFDVGFLTGERDSTNYGQYEDFDAIRFGIIHEF